MWIAIAAFANLGNDVWYRADSLKPDIPREITFATIDALQWRGSQQRLEAALPAPKCSQDAHLGSLVAMSRSTFVSTRLPHHGRVVRANRAPLPGKTKEPGEPAELFVTILRQLIPDAGLSSLSYLPPHLDLPAYQERIPKLQPHLRVGLNPWSCREHIPRRQGRPCYRPAASDDRAYVPKRPDTSTACTLVAPNSSAADARRGIVSFIFYEPPCRFSKENNKADPRMFRTD